MVEFGFGTADGMCMPPPKIPYFALAAATIPSIFCIYLVARQGGEILEVLAICIAAVAAAFVWVGCVLAALLLKEPKGMPIVGLSALGCGLFLWVRSHYMLAGQ